MQKRSLLFTLLLVFTLLLSACASGGDQEGSGTIVPGAGDTTGTLEGIPDTGASTEGAGDALGTVVPTMGAETTESVTEEASPTVEGTAGETSEAEPGGDVTGTVAPTEDGEMDATEAATPEAGGADTTPPASGTSRPGAGQGSGAGVIGIPETGGGLVGLTAMLDGWRVEGADGEEIGTVTDYVVNLCEAHILYLVVDPDEGVRAEGGQQILVPFEAVIGELNEGSSLDVQQGVFTLKDNAADLTGVPGVDIDMADLEDPDWSEDVLSYWSSDYRLSLTAGCSVPGSAGADQQETPGADNTAAGTPDAAGTSGAAGTPDAGQTATQPAAEATAVGTPTADAVQPADRQTVYRLALASKVLTADLREGNGRVLGVVQDIAIVPETGRTHYLVVETGETGQGAGRVVALPPGAVNVSYESGSEQPVLVLLVDTNLLQDAPEFDQDNTWTADNWFNFWSQHVPLTREQQEQQP